MGMVTIEAVCRHGASHPHPAEGEAVSLVASVEVLAEALAAVGALEVVSEAVEVAILVVEAPGEAGKMVK